MKTKCDVRVEPPRPAASVALLLQGEISRNGHLKSLPAPPLPAWAPRVSSRAPSPRRWGALTGCPETGGGTGWSPVVVTVKRSAGRVGFCRPAASRRIAARENAGAQRIGIAATETGAGGLGTHIFLASGGQPTPATLCDFIGKCRATLRCKRSARPLCLWQLVKCGRADAHTESAR